MGLRQVPIWITVCTTPSPRAVHVFVCGGTELVGGPVDAASMPAGVGAVPRLFGAGPNTPCARLLPMFSQVIAT